MSKRLRLRGLFSLSRLSNTSRGILAIVSGTTIGQLVTLAAIPAIARLYTPSEVGELAVITSLAFIGTTVAAGRYELAISLPRSDSEASLLAGLAIRLSLLFATLGSMGSVTVWSITGTDIFGVSLKQMLFVFALCGVGGIFGAYNYLAIRAARFGAVATRNFVRAVAVSAAQIGAAFTPLKGIGLPAGLLFGEAVATAFMAKVKGVSTAEGSRVCRRERRRELARAYIRFPAILAPSSLVNAAGQHGPVVLIAAFYGELAVGFLGMAQRAVAAPVGVITTAVSQVYISSFSRSVRERSPGAHRFFSLASRRLALVGMLVGVLLATLAPPVVEVVLGPSWQPSGDYVRALAPLVATQILSSPLSQTLVLLQHTSLQLLWDVARLVAVSLAILLSSAAGVSVLSAVWVYSIAAASLNLLAWVLSRWAIIRYERRLASGELADPIDSEAPRES